MPSPHSNYSLNSAINGNLFINNAWTQGSGPAFNSVNPANNKVVWQGHGATADEVDRAVSASQIAFKDWSRTTLADRLAYINNFKTQLDKHSEDIAHVIHEETGKPLWETITEVGAMIGKVDISIEAYHERTGHKVTTVNGVTTELQHKPQGVTAVFGPFNFPGHLPNGHILPSLIAGNTVIFKPSEQTPKTGELLMALWAKTGIPAGVIQLVQGEKDTGIALGNHPHIDGLFFTGSSATGALLQMQTAQQFGKILALELGGHNPLVVDEIENIPAAVYNAIQSCFISTGQRCTCARKLILVKNPTTQQFMSQFIKAAAKLKLTLEGNDGFMGPVIHVQQALTLLKKQALLQELGAKTLLDMYQPNPALAYVTPSILDVTGLSVPDEEDFGPIVKVYYCDTLEEALAEANNTQYGLSAGLFSDSAESWDQFQTEIRAGIVNWNKPTTGASGKAPFGGRGKSGNYRPGAYYAADYCAYPMASVSEKSASLPETLLPGVTIQR